MAERPLRVLVAHNIYRSEMPSGENMVVLDEIEMLREAGVEVIPFLRSSDSIPSMPLTQKLGVATGPVYNPWGVRDFKLALREEKPDVVHVHNVFPLLSPWIVREAKKAGIPVVQTVHNYRHSCVNGVHVRDGKVCDDCVGKRIAFAAVRHACYRSSRGQTLAMAAGQALHRQTWKGVDQYIALSPFMVDRLCVQGVPTERIVCRPTGTADPGTAGEPEKAVLYMGRLDPIKGIDTLLGAWAQSHARQEGWKLLVAGTGPLENLVLDAQSRDSSVVPLGALGPDAVRDAYRRAAGVLVPSSSYEGYPRVVAEAFANGRTVIASRLGSLATICGAPHSITLDPNVDAWRQELDRLSTHSLAELGSAARRHWELHLSVTSTTRTLIDIYRRLTGNTTNR